MMRRIAALGAIVWLALIAGASAQTSRTSNPDWPHVVSSTEGNWVPEPGYVWVDKNSRTNLAVRWEPGRAYYERGIVKWPHVIASATEGQWSPAPGYTWVDPANTASFAVRWNPGSKYWYLGHVRWPHVVAFSTEGRWVPQAGYEWQSASRATSGDFTVVSSAARQAYIARRSALNARWSAYLKQIQADGAYPNWSAPPFDLYRHKP